MKLLNLSTEIDIIFNSADSKYFTLQALADDFFHGKHPSAEEEEIVRWNLILSQVTEDLPLTLIIGFLTITRPFKDKLKFRTQVIEMVERIDPERKDRLLSGLR